MLEKSSLSTLYNIPKLNICQLSVLQCCRIPVHMVFRRMGITCVYLVGESEIHCLLVGLSGILNFLC
jgi:hypothetical protein